MFNPEELAYKAPEKKKFKLPRLKKPSRPSKKMGIILSGVIVVGLMVGGWFSYQNLKKQFQHPPPESVKNDSPPQQVFGLIESVEKKGIDLPDNEFPSVATVKELNKLSDQAFFEGAKEGDKVMIYTVSKRAFLFRPDTGEVIRQGPVQVVGDSEDVASSSSAVLSASDSASPALRIKY